MAGTGAGIPAEAVIEELVRMLGEQALQIAMIRAASRPVAIPPEPEAAKEAEHGRGEGTGTTD
jgi:hypothetical protein